jgi:hypothetical protein
MPSLNDNWGDAYAYTRGTGSEHFEAKGME